jgi:hypothetical protein
LASDFRHEETISDSGRMLRRVDLRSYPLGEVMGAQDSGAPSDDARRMLGLPTFAVFGSSDDGQARENVLVVDADGLVNEVKVTDIVLLNGRL